MLSLFPFALSFGLFAPTILRIVVSCALAYAAWKDLATTDMSTRFVGIAETLAAALLFVGLWTQAAALLSVVISGVWFYSQKKTYPTSTVLFVFAISISLFVMGAGRMAFDLPF